MVKRLALSALLVAVSAAAAAAQPVRFEHLTVDDGLAGNWVRAIVQDRHGFIWIGTQEGLNRYDGYGFRLFAYSPQNAASISSNSVTALVEDREGHLWVGTLSGLNRFDDRTETFHRYDETHGLSHRAVRAIYEDHDGTLWVGTSGGLHRWDPRSDTFSTIRYEPATAGEPSSPAATAVLRDREGTLWIGTQEAGLARFDEGSGSFRSVLADVPGAADASSRHVVLLQEDAGGGLWVATLATGADDLQYGLHRFDPTTGTFRAFHYTGESGDLEPLVDQPLSLSAILVSDDGTFWMTTYLVAGGLHRFDPIRGAFIEHHFYNPNDPGSLAWNYATALHRDRSGSLWVGTSRGVSRLDPEASKFGHFKEFVGHSDDLRDNIYPIVEDAQGMLWLGIAGPGELIEFDRGTGSARRHPIDPEAPASQTWALADDLRGRLWLGTNRGLYLFDLRSRRFERRRGLDAVDGPADGVVTALHRDRAGHMWIGTQEGLSRYDPDSDTFTSFAHDPADPHSLSGDKIRVIYEDRSGNVWIGTNPHPNDISGVGAEGLNMLDPATGRFVHYRHDPSDPVSISNNGINAIFEDRSGRIWVGTENGLNRLDPETGTFRYYLQEDGLPSGVIVGILCDDHGRLWISTQGGLSRFDPEAETFRNYDREDGIQNRRFNVGSYFQSPSGEMFFGGVSGLNYFFPDAVLDNPQIPPVVLTAFSLRDGRRNMSGAPSEIGDVTLPYRDNAFSFEFAALSFRSPEKNQYAYMLEGFDRDWVYSGNRRYASYTNLRSGTYTFRVKGSNNDGVWNEEGTSIRIRVLPPWWLTWWAYAFYGLALAGGVFGVDRHQRRRVIRKERERARERELEQAREIERAYEELKRTQAQLVQQEKLASLGQLTAGIAHEIKNPLNFVNNFAHLTEELAAELSEEIAAGRSAGEIEAVIADIRANASKIAEHGRRADGIVRSMLEHSRGVKGERQSVDVNALVEEYVNLAYHGKRAQNGEVDVRIERQYASEAGDFEVVPQDFGRVIVNLVGNAWDAVAERAATEADGYQPAVRVSTIRNDSTVEIRVSDNGPGIPEELRERIFEPFFTTKAAGSGTGLGLSLSHEIVTQGNGGSLTVESEPGQGTQFLVSLPST